MKLAWLPSFTLLLLVGCAASAPNETVRIFSRADAAAQPISVRLRWAPNHDPIYTPRGPMHEITIAEAGQSVSVPEERIHAIEDIWPERLRLVSPRHGDYDLEVPYGVGSGSLALIRVRAFRVLSVSDVSLAMPVPAAR